MADNESSREQVVEDEILHWLGILRDAESRLRPLLGSAASSDPELSGAIGKISRLGEQCVQTGSDILSTIPANIALLDSAGVIVQVNQHWQNFARDNHFEYGNHGVGSSYLSVCDRATGTCADQARQAGAGVRAVLAGDAHEFQLEYPCHSPALQRWFMMMVAAFDHDGCGGAMVMHIDITSRIKAERQVAHNASHLAALVDFEQQLLRFTGSSAGLLDRVASMACEIHDGDGAALLLLDGDHLECRAVAGIATPALGMRFPLDDSLSGQSIAGKQVLSCCDTDADPRADSAAFNALEARSLIVSPVADGGKVIGTIIILARDINRFGREDISSLELVAASLGNALQQHRSADQLQASERQYRLLFDNNPQPMWAYDLETLEFLAVNNAAIKHYGYSRVEFLTMTIADIRPAEELPRLLENIAGVSEGIDTAGIWTHRKKDGSLIDVEIVSHAMTLNGRRAEMVLVNDVTQQRAAQRELLRVSRAQKMLSDCNEVLFRASSEESLLEDIALIAVTTGDYLFAWVGFAEQDHTRSISLAAFAGAERFREFLSAMDLSWDGNAANGQGISGQTIRNAKPMICEDLSLAPGGSNAVSTAGQMGVHSLLSLPLLGRDGVFGLLALYSAETGGFPEDEVNLCQKLADNLAFGIEHLREVKERERLEAAVIKVASGVSSATGPVFFEHLALSVADTLGADVCIIARVLPGEPLQARTLAGVFDGNLLGPITYALDGTPCLALAEQGESVIEAGVRALYPDYVAFRKMNAEAYVGVRLQNSAGEFTGILFVVYRNSLQQRNFVMSTLRIFAARAASELERQDGDAHIYEQAALLDKAQDAIMVSELDGRIRYLNKAAERLFGWSAQEVLGQSSLELKLVDPDQLQHPSRQLLETGEWAGRLQQRRKDGSAFTVEAHWSLVRDEEGNPNAVFGISTDITERLALEDQLRQAQRLESLGQLTGGVAHDFNNLLTVIQGNAELLEEELEGQQRLSKLAEMIRKASQRGAQLTHRLLAIARRQVLEPRATDVNQLLRDMGDLLLRTFNENIQIKLVCPTNAWMALVDPGQLESAVLNLCINSRDAMPEGGKLIIETANCVLDEHYARNEPELLPGDYLMVAISDTGTGVPQEYIERIFDPFFTTKEKGKGTGLGLSMVYGFVKQSRGHIVIYSEQGLGTVVKIYLPRATEVNGKGANPNAVKPAQPGQGGETILLVEDDEMVRHMAHDMLNAAGYRVFTAENGASALECLKYRNDIELLFTDVIMPGGMNGPQLVQKALEIRPGLKVLYTSGYTENAIIHQGRLDPGVQLLNKPYRQVDLLAKIRHVLAKDSA